MSFIKRFIKSLLYKYGYVIKQIHSNDITDVRSISKINEVRSYSHFDEQSLINKYIKELKLQSRFCVDIAASDGVSMSNTYELFQDGWEGLAVEYNAHKFSKLAYTYSDFSGVNLAKCKVTPPNVISLLEGNEVPEKFGFLSLDIDGYDYFVLEQMLGKFRPTIICAEINEKIPPPLKFTVKWDPEFVWDTSHFFGQSISQLHLLCNYFKYALVNLHYNNAFLIPEEINIFPVLSPMEAYKNGYQSQPDRKEKFPWNENMEEILGLQPKEAVNFLNAFFKNYEGKYTISL